MPPADLFSTPTKKRNRRAAAKPAKNARTRAEFAKAITEAWQSTLDGIFRTGLMLETAKAELPHGEWLLMIENDLPFGARTAQRLMAIVDDKNPVDTTHASHLPVSWMTLYELSKLDDETFTAAIEDGRINPKMQRKDALALRPGRKCKAAAKRPRSKNPNVVSACVFDVQGRVNEIFDELDEPDRDDLLTTLAHFLETLKKLPAKGV